MQSSVIVHVAKSTRGMTTKTVAYLTSSTPVCDNTQTQEDDWAGSPNSLSQATSPFGSQVSPLAPPSSHTSFTPTTSPLGHVSQYGKDVLEQYFGSDSSPLYEDAGSAETPSDGRLTFSTEYDPVSSLVTHMLSSYTRILQIVR